MIEVSRSGEDKAAASTGAAQKLLEGADAYTPEDNASVRASMARSGADTFDAQATNAAGHTAAFALSNEAWQGAGQATKAAGKEAAKYLAAGNGPDIDLQQLHNIVDQLGSLKNCPVVNDLLSHIPADARNQALDIVAKAPTYIQQIQSLVDGIGGVENVSFGFTKDGKYSASIKRKEDTRVPVNEKQGPVTVSSVDLAKDLSFTVGKEGDNIKLEDIQGIKVNAVLGALGIEKGVSVDLKAATLIQKDGKSVLKAEIAHPSAPSIHIPIEVPLEAKK